MVGESRNNENSSSKQKDLLSRIVNTLTINGSFIDSPGLGNGKMGIAIFIYNYSRNFSRKDLELYSDELIDEIYREISINTLPDFENGLTGIGWGIEYLLGNGFVEGDTGEILEEIDSTLLKYLSRYNVKDRNVKAKEIRYDIYTNARHRKSQLILEELNPYLKVFRSIEDLFFVQKLIASENYGLFNGLAGAGQSMLTDKQKIE